jgi:outer membrane biosynthesis protein TonB
MRQCDVCRKKISPDALFCPHCGEPYGIDENLSSLSSNVEVIRKGVALLYRMNAHIAAKQIKDLGKDSEFEALAAEYAQLFEPPTEAPAAPASTPAPAAAAPQPAAQEQPVVFEPEQKPVETIEIASEPAPEPPQAAEKPQAAKPKPEKPKKKETPTQPAPTPAEDDDEVDLSEL